MADKVKRHLQPNLWPLYALERGFYWITWLIVAATVFIILRMNIDNIFSPGGEITLQRMGLIIFNVVIQTIVFGLIGAVPTTLAFAVSRLLRWSLSQNEQTTAQAETIKDLLQEKRELEMTIRLMELDASGHHSAVDEEYEREDVWQRK